MKKGKGKPVDVKAAKGRPMLTWVGKRPLRGVTAYPAQQVETFDPTGSLGKKPEEPEIWKDWPKGYPKGGLLFHGDNKEVLAHLLANGFRGKVNLVYIDPPFDSGADYVRKVSLRGPKGTAKLDGETYSLGEQLQYTDIWANDNYLQFMYERLQLLREVLAPAGSLFLQADSGRAHYLKLLLDEVFGAEAFRNELVVKRRITKNLQAQFEKIREYPQAHDVVLWYCKSTEERFRAARSQKAETTEGYWHHFWSGEDRRTMRYELFGQTPATGQWKWKRERAHAAASNYREFQRQGGTHSLEEYWEATGRTLEFLRLNEETGTVENWFPPSSDRIANTLWLDVHAYENQKSYPTEKHVQLLSRIIEYTGSPGDVVFDSFIGSGTTAVAAQKLGRRWIGCDINKGAIQTTAKRLMRVVEEQLEEAGKREAKGKQQQLEGIRSESDSEEAAPRPAQWGFTVWRVNDYDLAIRTTEAVGLACEHLGVSRTRTDRFFDGTLGKRLVKIVPFDHPLTPLDLEELRKELDARPDEDRDVVVATLGCEIAARSWVEDWNRLRKGKGAANKIEIVELRSDPRVGGFFTHQPATAKVKVARKKDKVVVEILDFVSPSILQRLKEQASIVEPLVEDFRAMIDWIEVDADYDGKVFRVALVDLPEKKQDLIAGRYELDAPKKGATVAVKIVDMLGEEVLKTHEV